MKLFNLNTPVMHILGKIIDLVVLNLLFLICSLPLITIGATCTALYSVTLKMVQDEESYIIKDFFSSFIINFKVSTLSWLVVIFLGMTTSRYIQLIEHAFGGNASHLILFLLPLIACFSLCALYLFPYISYFEKTVSQAFKNAFIIAILNLPYTFLLIFVYAVAVWLFLLAEIELLWFIGMLMGFSACAYATSMIYRRIFARYEKMFDD